MLSISSLFHTELAARSLAVSELFATAALHTLHDVSCTLFHVPPKSPESCTLPAVLVVAYGTLAEFPIFIQAAPLQR